MKDECPNCGVTGDPVVPVWENPGDYKRGKDPDFIGCKECNVMEPYNG